MKEKILSKYKKLHFLHNPKTAGTSIEEGAYKNGIMWGRHDKTLNKIINCSEWHTPQYIEECLFCVIRNPFDKIISQYYFKDYRKKYSKENLNLFINESLLNFKKNKNFQDNHWLQQSEFFKYCDIVISFENLQENLNVLTKLFNLKEIKLEHYVGGINHGKERPQKIIKRFTEDDISEKNKLEILKIYEEDFRLWEEVKEKEIVYRDNKKPVIKTKNLFIYWDKKFINSPEIIKSCLISWKINNPTWKIIELNDDNLYEYIDIKKEIPEINNKVMEKAGYSDIVRIFLLEKYGGVWCDATAFCHVPLDFWLYKFINEGFVAFTNIIKNRTIRSWFLYGEKDNYIIKKWKEKTINYWNNNKSKNLPPYFWFHYLFTELVSKDKTFEEIWDKVPKIYFNRVINPGRFNVVSKLTYRFSVNYSRTQANNLKENHKSPIKFIKISGQGNNNLEDIFYKNNIDSLKYPSKLQMYNFCFVNNPFNRLINQYVELNNNKNINEENLNKFLEETLEKLEQDITIQDNYFIKQSESLKDCHIMLSTKNIEKNLKQLCNLFFIPNFNITIEKKHNLTEKNINDKNKEKILKLYKEDFNLYNKVNKYEFYLNTKIDEHKINLLKLNFSNDFEQYKKLRLNVYKKMFFKN